MWRSGNPNLFPELEIPRSTALGWIRRGVPEVVTVEELDRDFETLLLENRKLGRERDEAVATQRLQSFTFPSLFARDFGNAFVLEAGRLRSRIFMIEARKLTYTYAKAGSPALRDIEFSVDHGEIFGFLGPSGSGKSTTQKVLIGLLEGYGGEVRVLNKDRAAWAPDDYEKIGVSFETPNHFLKLSALENLRYFAALYRRATRPPQVLLEKVGLADDGAMLVGKYSKGMKNRLSIARCLLNDPDLLFLDEPTTGLDPVNAQNVKDLIRAERQAGKTVFLTTHDMVVADELF